MKNPWDRIITSAPLDKQAAIVRDGKGEHFTPQMRLEDTKVRQIAPPPMRPNPPNAEDLTGQRFGRFAVIGRSADKPAWVVRCACGWYEHRNARALKTAGPADLASMMCTECCYVERVKAGLVLSPNERAARRAAKQRADQ